MRNMKNKTSWVEKAFILFILLFALEPLAGFSRLYYMLMLVLGAVSLVSIIYYVSGILTGKRSVLEIRRKTAATAYLRLAISALGMVVALWCRSDMYVFWIFIFAMELTDILVMRIWNRRR